MPTVIIFLEATNQPVHRICPRNRVPDLRKICLSLMGSQVTPTMHWESLLVKQVNLSATGNLSPNTHMDREAQAQLEGN